MCYHSATPNKENLKKALGPKYKIKDFQSYGHANGFDHPDLPATAMGHPFEVGPLTWGLVPSFINNIQAAEDISNKTLNARSESVFDLPSFKESIKASRCIIYVNGFYEWQHAGKQKVPHYLSLPGKIMALGGLASQWTDRSTGEIHDTCSIITTPANTLMASIHNKGQRMPLILPPAVWEQWLDPSITDEQIRALMQPYAFTDLAAQKISSIKPPEAQVPAFYTPPTEPLPGMLF